MPAKSEASLSFATSEIIVRAATIADLETIVAHRRGMFRDMGSEELEKIAKNSRPYLERGLRQ
jgi:hypothetical protein